MIPTQFEYAVPETLAAALKALGEHRGAAVLAGGQSLVPAMTARRIAPSRLVDLRRIAELRGITAAGPGLQIGAMTTLAELGDSEAVRTQLPALADAAASIRDPLVKNRGTFGGNLLSNHMATDLPAVALALEATFVVAGPEHERRIAADRFYAEGTSAEGIPAALARDEILTGLEIAAAPASAYEKFRQPASGYPICGVAARVERTSQGTFARCWLAVTGASQQPTRLPHIEAALEGKPADAGQVAAAVTPERLAELAFLDDFAAGAAYRAHLTAVLAERALLRAFQRGAG